MNSLILLVDMLKTLDILGQNIANFLNSFFELRIS
jgi:hypothetical protein